MDFEVEVPEHHGCSIVNKVMKQLDENLLYQCNDDGGQPLPHTHKRLFF